STSEQLAGKTIRSLALSPSFAKDKTLFAAAAERGEAGTEPAATQLWISRDGGKRWEQAREGFDDREIVAIACSPAYGEDKTVYLGTFRDPDANRRAEVSIWRSEDGGRSWLPLTQHF